MPVNRQDVGPATGPGHGRLRLLVLLGVLVLAAAITTAAVVRSRAHSAATHYPEVPPIGSAAPPVCPATWAGGTVSATRAGLLVPPDATEALLCSYPFTNEPMPLGGSRRTTSRVGDLIRYLNALPTSRPTDEACLMIGGTQYVIVLGYHNRQPATVYLRDCAYEQSGAARYGGNLTAIIAFWGVPPRQ